jgi:transposase
MHVFINTFSQAKRKKTRDDFFKRRERMPSLSEVKKLKANAASEQEHRRFFAIELLLRGEDRETVVRILELGINTLNSWIQRVNERGLKYLKTQPGRGAKSRLTPEQKQEVKEAILKNPRSLGYKESNWTGRLLIRRIKKHYGVDYKQANIYILLKELGISYQRPTRLYGECKEEVQESFKKNSKKS